MIYYLKTGEIKMGKKILFVLCSVWSAFIAFISPVLIGFIYMSVTGHGKGYDYDLGIEKDISVAFGLFFLLIWLSMLIPPLTYIFYKIANKGKIFIILTIIIWFFLFIMGIFRIGGFEQFLLFFNVRL